MQTATHVRDIELAAMEATVDRRVMDRRHDLDAHLTAPWSDHPARRSSNSLARRGSS